MTLDITKVLIDGTYEGRTNSIGLFRLCDVFEINANQDDPCGCTYTICLNDTGATNGQVLTRIGENTFGWTTVSGGGGGLSAVVDDLTPQLGGDLDLNTHNIIGSGNITITGNVDASGYGEFGNLRLTGNSLVSTNTDGNINITPNGNGQVVIDGLTWPNSDGTAGQVLTTNGAGVLSWTTVSGGGGMSNFTLTPGTNITLNGGGAPVVVSNGSNITIASTGGGGGGISAVVDDTTPQLGGDLDVNGHSIVSTSNGDINITPNGSGSVVLDGLSYPQADGTANQLMGTDGAGQIQFGNITLTAGTNISFSGGSPATLGLGSNVTINSTSSPALSITKVQLFEDFILGVNGDYWSGTIAVNVDSEANHLGIAYPTDFMQSATTMRFADLDYLKVSVRLNDITLTGAGSKITIGFGSSNGVTSGDNEAICFSYTVGGTNWFAVNNTGGYVTSTTTDTGVAISLSWTTFEIVKSGTDVVFKINGSTVATHSTNIPSAYTPIKILTSVNEVNPIGIDYIAYESQTLTR